MVNGEARRMLATLATASILGAWAFAATRASSGDIDSVRAEITEVEDEAKARHEKLAATVDDIQETIQAEAIEAATFRAEVRTALRIREDPSL